MKTLVYSDESPIRGGIEIFADRQVARLRAEGRDVAYMRRPPDDFSKFGEIFVHKCRSVDVLEAFPPERTTIYIHDHEPICPRTYAYTPLRRNCQRPGGLWPCVICAPLCRDWRGALARVFSQRRRIAAISKMAKIVVLSEFMKGRLVANGVDADRISVEPPQVSYDIAALPAGEPPAPDIDMLFAGQLIRGKGLQLLFRAMALMETRRTLDVVGAGNMKGGLTALAGRLGLSGRIRWRGFQPNVADWMRAARCVVVPSFWQEPYGLVAAEAVALGKPVVAFGIGGLPEACGGKATLVPPGDIRALALALDDGAPAGLGETGER